MEVEIQPLCHLPSQVPMGICLPRERGLHVSPVLALFPIGKVIGLPGLGFPFEKLSSIKQRFNPDKELELLGPLKNTDVQASSQTNDQILGWGGWVGWRYQYFFKLSGDSDVQPRLRPTVGELEIWSRKGLVVHSSSTTY